MYFFTDLIDNLLGTVMVLFIVVVALVLTAMVVDVVQDYRSEPQQIACRAKREDHIRRSFTTNVNCVPVLTKRDTITVLAR